jgi:hypothetical protein
MPGEFDNPARRYKWFRPRQANRGVISLAGPTNSATLSLFNNSTGAHLLVVRAWSVAPTTAMQVLIASQRGPQGSAGGVVTPIVAGEAAQAGALYSLDTATALTPDWIAPVQTNWATWAQDFPFAIVMPGWSLSFQDSTAAETMYLAIFWEAILPDELDFMW